MAHPLRDVRVVGLHPVEMTPEMLDDALEIQWGPGLAGDDLEDARREVRAHFAGLYVIELQLEPGDAEFDWAGFAQSQDGVPESDWQVAYDERPIDEAAGKWAFFLHGVDTRRALETPVGPRPLPPPSPCPDYLRHIRYEVP
jgi:hypothetical protein